jgi:hypothetical protein
MSTINDRVPISKESKDKLSEETFLNIELFSQVVDDIRRSIEVIKITCSNLKKKDESFETSNEILHLIRLSEYRLLIGLIWLDIASSIRVYLKAELKYEGIYASKQLIITINEAYKKIYNFIQVKEEKEILKDRNSSFWIKDIGKLITENLISLEQQYNDITIDLDSYFNEHFKDSKTNRDLLVHYDNEPSKVYDLLTSLDIEEIFQKVIPFINILKKMVDFTKDILIEFNKFTDDKRNQSLDEHSLKFEKLKQKNNSNTQANDFIDEIKDQLMRFKRS